LTSKKRSCQEIFLDVRTLPVTKKTFQGDHPFKLLRAIVGATQKDFADSVGLSVDAVVSAELGRRRVSGEPSPEQLEQIQSSIGAIWDPHNHEWYFDPGGLSGRRMKYARDHYDTFRKELTREAQQRALLVYYLTFRFHRFCAEIGDETFNRWFWQMEQQFDRWANEFGISHEIEAMLEPVWDQERGQMIGYRKFFPDLLQGEEKAFSQMIEAARKEKQSTAELIFPRIEDKQFKAVRKSRSAA
jgi:transcriptional regulator with XRE-family HTH domain